MGSSRSFAAVAVWLLLVSCVATTATAGRVAPLKASLGGMLARRFLFLVSQPTVTLEYHNGPVLTGSSGSISVYIIWYGNFLAGDKSTVQDFLSSFSADTDVARWWSVTSGFKDTSGGAVAANIKLAGELDDSTYSLGNKLTNADIETLVLNSLTQFPASSESIYFVLTSEDVEMEDFCMNSCSSHFASSPSKATGGMQLPYAWIGNPKTQCPGMCAWPFAQPSYMPATSKLPLPPNGNLGSDALVIQMGYMLAGTASNPFDNAYYQGDAAAPLEAGTACTGSFGVGAYPGYPGELKTDVITGGVYNAQGINGRKFVLPTLWDPAKRDCTPLAIVA